MQEFWEKRYGESVYAYGKEPNAFFQQFLETYPEKPGKLLLPGEGEGRNAVYAASLGWVTQAFDYSTEAKAKALALAAEKQVRIDYSVSEVADFDFAEEQFDLVGLFFVHLPPELRQFLHRQVARSLKPGGKVVLEAFSPAQLAFDSGGPKKVEMLYDRDTLASDFADLHLERLEEQQTELSEGPYHSGPAAVTRLIGKKP